MKDGPIRILQVVPNMQQGGLENFIMNLYRNIDREKVQFDFLVHYTRKEYFDEEIENLGGKIYRFNLRENNNIFKYMIQLNKFFKEHKEYKVIHCHMSSIGFIVFNIAKYNGIKIRIAHSHNADTEKTLKGFIKSIIIKPYKYVSTINFACSKKAGEYLFKNKTFEIIPNAIELEKYKFDYNIRENMRKKLNIKNDELIIGHIGRFERQKNHIVLIDIFKKIVDKQNNAKLILIGNGGQESLIKEKVKSMNLEKKVLFLGIRDDVNKLYQAMDCFLLPSLFEGLPLVGVEAQTSGLSCIFSDTITQEIKISDNTCFLSLDNLDKWVDEVLSKKEFDRNDGYKNALNSQYNIKNIAKNVQKIYTEEFYK